MPDNCTIFAHSRDLGLIADIIRRISPNEPEMDGQRENWSKIRIASQGASLTFTSLLYTEPQDQFSRILLATGMYLREIVTDDASRTQTLSTKLYGSELAIGVMGEPEFREDLGHFDYIWAVAEGVDGILFNGSDFLDSSGNTLMDAEGHYD